MRCYICKRRMFTSGALMGRLFGNRINCGGDCWHCIKEIEREMAEDDNK